MARLVNEGAPDGQWKSYQRKHDDETAARAKAKGLLTFTLTEADISTPETIVCWIFFNLRTAPVAKLRDAFEDMLSILTSTTPKKHAD